MIDIKQVGFPSAEDLGLIVARGLSMAPREIFEDRVPRAVSDLAFDFKLAASHGPPGQVDAWAAEVGRYAREDFERLQNPAVRQMKAGMA